MKRAPLLVFCLVLGCSTPSSDASADSPEEPTAAPEEAAPPPPPLWTTVFEPEAVLMAASVRIEGPPGLRYHIALVQDSAHHRHNTTTTAEGLLQTTLVRDDVGYLAPIRCQLDNLTIVAERELVVLERPGAVPVVVAAEGDCFYKLTDSAEESRGAALRLVGPVQ